MHVKKIIVSAAALLAVSAGAAGAQDQEATVTFGASLLGSCALAIGTPGTLALSPDGKTLSSAQSGGISGTATVLTTGLGYDLTVVKPTSFSDFPDGGQADSIEMDYTADGGLLGDLTSLLNLPLGSTTLTIDLEAQKNTGVFPAGDYAADVTVRCT
jgi:hypothetical protein